MTLHEEWRWIVRKAWSFRLILLAAVLSGLEVVMPLVQSDVQAKVFGLASFVVTAAALVARVVAQQKEDRGRRE